jgi:hypothetical protein
MGDAKKVNASFSNKSSSWHNNTIEHIGPPHGFKSTHEKSLSRKSPIKLYSSSFKHHHHNQSIDTFERE